jgi:outer membrane lipoprotein-sorting protein
MKHFVPVLLFFFLSGLGAQEDITRYRLNASSMDAFTETVGQLSKNKIVVGNFDQEKFLSRHNRSLKSSGNFIIASELGMVWETLKPFPSVMTMGNDYLIQSRPGGQGTVLSAQGNETFISFAEAISSVFSGNTQGLLNNFEVYFLGNTADWTLWLLPKSRAIAAFAERITMKGDTVIRSILIYEQNNDTVSYVLSNHRFPSELTENEKSFFTLP